MLQVVILMNVFMKILVKLAVEFVTIANIIHKEKIVNNVKIFII